MKMLKKKKYALGGNNPNPTFQQVGNKGYYYDPNKNAYIQVSDNAQSNNDNTFTKTGNNASGIIQPIASMAGGLFSTLGERPDGSVDTGMKIASGALSGAGTGFAMGSSFGPIGMAIGAVGGAIAGGVTSGISAASRNKQIANDKIAAQEREKADADNYSRAVLNIFPTSGVKSAQYYYAMGGTKYCGGGRRKMALGAKVPGGNMLPITKTQGIALADGKTHEQGGIDMSTDMEIEDGEVVKENPNSVDIYSNRLQLPDGSTYADRAKQIADKIAIYEKQLKAPSMYVRNSAKREIEKLNAAMQQLMQHQEMTKNANGIENPQGQAPFGDTISKLYPYIDNLGNAILTGVSPKVPKPIQNVSVPMKTEYNIEAPLAESKRQVNQLVRNMEQNVANSSTLRSNAIASNVVNTANINKLYTDKENLETQMKNQEALNRQQIVNSNKALERQYNIDKFNRVNDIHSRISENLANLSQDAALQKAEYNEERRDLLELELIKKQYQESGIWDRNLQDLFDSYAKGDTRFEDFIAKLKERKELRKAAKENKDSDANIDYSFLRPNVYNTSSSLNAKRGFIQR